MTRIAIILLTLFTSIIKLPAQPCGAIQKLSTNQQTQINVILKTLNTALYNEDLLQIDSLSINLKNTYSVQGGLPDGIEKYYNLVANSNWPNAENAVLLSRKLISVDSMTYVHLWKAAKGMKPPLNQPNSLFLRASAEIATGLLKIAHNETNLNRKALYKLWATKALDSLATMQLPNGAFPFPDLRTYDDPIFTPIIQKFITNLGLDSVNVLQNGWIIDDKETGEFKFDAGIIANAFYEAYQYTGNANYRNITISVGNYLKKLKFNTNYNYNTFVSLGLTRTFQLTNDSSYLNRAIINLRYAVYPGQLENGRWVDGHNANSRYHSIIIQNIVPSIPFIPAKNRYRDAITSMTYKAVKNMVEYSFSCNSSTGYRWLTKAHQLNSSIIPPTLKDSISNLLGRYINQSAINGKYLDVPTMGDFLELYEVSLGYSYAPAPLNPMINTFPNPTHQNLNIVCTIPETNNFVLSLFDIKGNHIKTVHEAQKAKGIYTYQIDLSHQQPGIYILKLQTPQQNYTHKIIRTE